MRVLIITSAVLAAVVTAAAQPEWLHPGEKPTHDWPGWPTQEPYTHGPPHETQWPTHPFPTWPGTSTLGSSSSATHTGSSISSKRSSAPSVPTSLPRGSSTSLYRTGSSIYTNSSSTSSTPTSLGACGTVSSLASSFRAASPQATPTVPAAIAYDCITSVPFNSSAAVAYLDSIRPYINWQTTIEYLKDPPAEYAEKIQPPYDFFANWDRIYSSAQAGAYANEYAFGFDLYELFQKAHDGHFVVYPDSSNLIFSYGRTLPLVSVSLDGQSIPEVYAYPDILALTAGNATFKPSPLTMIDGENSTEWLLNFSQYGSLQDRDALWNNMFYLLAQVSLGSSGTGTGTFSGSGRGRWIYPGPTTELVFANGTSLTLNNFARVLVPFDGINTGEDLYQTYFAVPGGSIEPAEVLATMTYPTSSASAVSTTSSTSATSTTIPAPGFPSPIIREKNNLNSGYFLSGAGYDDVAVLSVPSFVASDDEIDFQAVNTYFINRAVAANKTKLIVDLSANGGGTILQGYDLFKQLFPSILPYGGNRFRTHEAFDLIGQEVSYFSGLVPRSLSTNESDQDLVSSAWNYRTDADINYVPFTSWEEKNGPHAYGPEPDNFTSILRWNMSDVLTPDNSGGIYISGYLNRSNITTQPFAAENIVMIYDGYCASTCTIFSELMRQQGGVKTIALGGRPNKDIIQAVGGVKGVNDLPYDYILSLVEVPFAYQYIHSAEYYNTTALADYNDLALYRSEAYVVNARDGIRQGDTTETPLQFVYEPADCRVYYTPAMAVDQTALWKTIADTAFNGVNHCVAGSYPSNSTKASRRRLRPRTADTVPARTNLNLQEHYDAMENVWTGKGGLDQRGDAIMIV